MAEPPILLTDKQAPCLIHHTSQIGTVGQSLPLVRNLGDAPRTVPFSMVVILGGHLQAIPGFVSLHRQFASSSRWDYRMANGLNPRIFLDDHTAQHGISRKTVPQIEEAYARVSGVPKQQKYVSLCATYVSALKRRVRLKRDVVLKYIAGFTAAATQGAARYDPL